MPDAFFLSRLAIAALSPLHAAWLWVMRQVRGRRKSMEPADRIAKREKWKDVVETRIRTTRSTGLRDEVIIRDVARLDDYDRLVNSKKIEDAGYFRAGLIDTYSGGLTIGLEFVRCAPYLGGTWRTVKAGTEKIEGERGFVVAGLLPWENVESIDWHGDDFYGFPHIFCHFAEKAPKPFKATPFTARELFEGRGEGARQIWVRVDDFDAALARQRLVDGVP